MEQSFPEYSRAEKEYFTKSYKRNKIIFAGPAGLVGT
jgi:hypothetical protein